MRKISTEHNSKREPGVSSSGPLTDTIKIADIAIRDDWQVRNKINPVTVNNYRNIYKNGGQLSPIQVALVDGTFRLVDGWHRLEALRLLGRDEVEATIFEATMNEARWAAARANLTHGLPLKSKEVRNVFNAYITSRQHYKANGRIKSYRDMEADLGGRVSYRTLNTWMKKDHPKIAKVMAEQYGTDKAQYRDGGPPSIARITPYEVAIEHLDNALAEARSLPPEQRRDMIEYGKRLLARLEKINPWTAQEIAEGLPWMPENSDF